MLAVNHMHMRNIEAVANQAPHLEPLQAVRATVRVRVGSGLGSGSAHLERLQAVRAKVESKG